MHRFFSYASIHPLLTVIGIFFGGIIAGQFLLGTRLLPSLFPQPAVRDQASAKAVSHERVWDGITIVSELDRKMLAPLIRSMQFILRPDRLPARIEIHAIADESRKETHYVGSWYIGDKLFFILSVWSPHNNTFSYFRVWFLTAGNDIDQETAAILMSQNFNSSFSAAASRLACGDAIGAESNTSERVCGFLDNAADGEKHGSTARAPIMLAPDHPVVMVAACIVPAPYSLIYPSNQCL